MLLFLALQVSMGHVKKEKSLLGENDAMKRGFSYIQSESKMILMHQSNRLEVTFNNRNLDGMKRRRTFLNACQ